MSFQSTVGFQFRPGQAGEIAADGPIRAKSARILAGAAGTSNSFSKVFTYASPDITMPGIQQQEVVVGGAGPFFGMSISPKEHVLFGSGNDPLGASMDLPTGSECSFADMGIFFANLLNLPITAGTVSFTFGAKLVFVASAPSIAAATVGMIIPLDPTSADPVLTGYTFTAIPGARLINTITAPTAGNSDLSKIQLTQ